jgi:hypothetical protein
MKILISESQLKFIVREQNPWVTNVASNRKNVESQKDKITILMIENVVC